MEYHIVRIYRRETEQAVDGNLRDNRLTGQIEDDNGHKETFHDAETLWRLLTRERSAVKEKGPENSS